MLPTSNKSCSALNFGQKSPRGHMSTSPQSGAMGLERWYGLIWNCIEAKKYILFWAKRCRKYALSQKKLQINVFRHQITDKKVREGICVSPTRVDPGARKIWFKYKIVQKQKNTFTFVLNAAKNTDYPQKSFKQKFFSIELENY